MGRGFGPICRVRKIGKSMFFRVADAGDPSPGLKVNTDQNSPIHWSAAEIARRVSAGEVPITESGSTPIEVRMSTSGPYVIPSP